MLVIIYTTSKLHHYLYRLQFTVETDKNLLDDNKKKNISLAPPRIRGMTMLTSQYDFQLEHRPGKELVLPDTLNMLSTAENYQILGLKINVHSIVKVTDALLK